MENKDFLNNLWGGKRGGQQLAGCKPAAFFHSSGTPTHPLITLQSMKGFGKEGNGGRQEGKKALPAPRFGVSSALRKVGSETSY